MPTGLKLAGRKLGCWRVLRKAPSKVENCGTTRSYWTLICSTCGSRFSMTTRNITRKKGKPMDCKNCRGLALSKGEQCDIFM